jgi:hypothetical protein
MGFFKEIAQPLIARGIPVIPLRPKSKIAFLTNWTELATVDSKQIEKWDREYPNANAACVAFARQDGIWIFELDRENYHQEITKQTGMKMPVTFMVRSSPGRGHYFFKQTAASIAMGNRQAEDAQGELWSARVDKRYVVSPGSIHPKTGMPYEVVRNTPIIEAPDWLVQWCSGQIVSAPKITDALEESPIIEGSRNNTITSLLGKARQNLGMDRDQLLEFGLSLNQKRCHPPLPDSEIKTIANSVARYNVVPTGPSTVIMGQTDADKKAQAEKKSTLESTIRAANPKLSDATVARMVHQIQAGCEEEYSANGSKPDFIHSDAFASTRLSDIYQEVFEPNDWPLVMALPALVTAASVVVPPQPRPESGMMIGDDPMVSLYTALIAEVNAGKSQMMKWAARAIGIMPEDETLGTHYYEGKWGSGEQMLRAIQKKQSNFVNRTVLITSDELSHLFAKATIEKASLPMVLDTAFYKRHHNFTLGGHNGGTEYNLNVAMSLIGGIVESEFDTVFGAGTLGGLYDRFLFGRAPTNFKWDYRPCPILETRQWSTWDMKPVRQDASVWEVTKGWKRKNPEMGRISELCVRIATIFASVDGRSEITGKDIEPLESLAANQLNIRGVYQPNAGLNYEAVFANKALAWIDDKATEWKSIRDLKRDLKRVEAKVGPVIALRTLRSLAYSGSIDMWESKDETKNPRPTDYVGGDIKIGLVRKAR